MEFLSDFDVFKIEECSCGMEGREERKGGEEGGREERRRRVEGGRKEGGRREKGEERTGWEKGEPHNFLRPNQTPERT
jgi:hypothetical protein